MKILIKNTLLIMLTLVALISCNQSKRVQSTSKVSTKPTSNAVISIFSKIELLQSVNKYRAKSNVCGNQKMKAVLPLVWSDLLEKAAEIHTLDMSKNNFMDHISKTNGSNPKDRIEKVGYKFATLAENIAFGYPSVDLVVDNWMKSPGHCKNIMKPDVTEIGVTVDKNYWTMILAKPRN